MNNERYIAEIKPAYRLQHEEPAPLGTKCIFLTQWGSAVVGHWYPECGFLAWAPLPSLTPEQKEKLKERMDGQ